MQEKQMTVQRTKQDIINRREANRRYYKLEENKEAKRAYQRKYNLGLRGSKQTKPVIYPTHEELATKNGYRAEDLHAVNSKAFVDYNDKKN